MKNEKIHDHYEHADDDDYDIMKKKTYMQMNKKENKTIMNMIILKM